MSDSSSIEPLKKRKPSPKAKRRPQPKRLKKKHADVEWDKEDLEAYGDVEDSEEQQKNAEQSRRLKAQTKRIKMQVKHESDFIPRDDTALRLVAAGQRETIKLDQVVRSKSTFKPNSGKFMATTQNWYDKFV